MSHQGHEKVIYVISKQIQFIVIEPHVSCWANTDDNWKSTESLLPIPNQHHVEATVSPHLCDYTVQLGSESSGETESFTVGNKTAYSKLSTTRTRDSEDGLLGRGGEDKISGSLSEVSTAVKV